MIAIADTFNTRNKGYVEAISRRAADVLAGMVREVRVAGADMINIQCSLDGSGDEDNLPWVVSVISDIVDIPLSLDSRNIVALEKSIPLCKEPPLVNFISRTEPEDRDALLSLVSRTGSSLVLRASGGTVPSSLEAKLQIIEELIEKANDADIPNERLFADPSIVHIGSGMGQRHVVNSHECILALNELVEPPIGTIAWVSNISSGMQRDVRKPLEAAFLVYLAGAGLDAAIVDILDARLRKALYLVKAFRDDIVFSAADLAEIDARPPR